jgi:hypothetical protein
MTTARAFRGFRFPAEVILWAVRQAWAWRPPRPRPSRATSDRARRGPRRGPGSWVESKRGLTVTGVPGADGRREPPGLWAGTSARDAR